MNEIDSVICEEPETQKFSVARCMLDQLRRCLGPWRNLALELLRTPARRSIPSQSLCSHAVEYGEMKDSRHTPRQELRRGEGVALSRSDVERSQELRDHEPAGVL